MKKIQIVTILLVLFSFALSILANNNIRSGSAASFAANQKIDDESFKWQINIKVNDDVGITVEEAREALEKAFKNHGDTIDEIASPDSTSIYVVIGKDDADDNNDGEADAEDSDKYGNGLPDEDEEIEIHNLDEEIPDGWKDYSDDDKNAGSFVSITNEYGNTDVYITKRDSLEPEEAAQAIVKTKNNRAAFIPASFSFRALDPGCHLAFNWITCMENWTQLQREKEAARLKKQKEDDAVIASKNWTTLMTSGKTLTKGEKITDPTSGSYFIYQEDGNVVLYPKSGQHAWASGSWIFPYQKAGNLLKMQPDGNLVAVSTFMDKADWVSGTGNNPGAYLQVEWKLLRLRIVDKTGKHIKLL